MEGGCVLELDGLEVVAGLVTVRVVWTVVVVVLVVLVVTVDLVTSLAGGGTGFCI